MMDPNMMGDDGQDPEETPNHHLPRMSDHDNYTGHNHPLPSMTDPSGRHPHHQHNNNGGPPYLPPHHGKPVQLYAQPPQDPEETPNHHLPRMSDLDNYSSGHKHPLPNMADPSGHQPHHQHNNDGGPPYPPPRCGKPVQSYTQPPHVDGLPLPHGKPSRRHNHSPPPYRHGYGHEHSHSSSRAGAFASVATLLLLIGLTALILYLVYRPNTPHFSVVAASIYLLNTTAPTASTASVLATSLQITVVTRNSHRRTSLYYDHLRAQVYYRDQAITAPTELPPLYHIHHTTVVFSPVLGGAMLVAPGVVEELVADETYGMMELRLVVMGRVRYKAGFIWTAHYGVYVGCDLLVGVKKEVVGAVPLLANHDCKVDM